MIPLNSLVNTFFYSGKSPFAPGTVGSIFAFLVWFLFNPAQYIMVIGIVLLGLISFYTISSELITTQDKDPQHIVVDEVVGAWLALLFLTPNTPFYLVVIAFLLFRMFDIFKPSLIYRVQFAKGAWGVLLDDLFAGLFAGLITLGISSL